MAWIYLAESEESPLPYRPGCGLLPIVKSTLTLPLYFCSECSREIFREPLYGTTCKHCPTASYQLTWISSQEDSPARTLALQEMERAWRESEADYSLKLLDWLASADLDSFSWKTCQLSLVEDLNVFAWNSLRSGTTVDGRLYQPQKLEPSTFVNDGSFLPTPTACDYGKNVGRKSDGITPSGRDRWSITVRARRGELPGHPRGPLNPEWVEMAMGYPTGWTAIEDWAMQWFRTKRGKRSGSSRE